MFESVPFPGGPFDVPDEIGDGRPRLVILSYDAEAIGAIVESIPPLIERIYSRKNSDGAGLRALRNHLVFIVADEARKDEMRRKMARRLALRELIREDRLAELAPHQREAVRRMETGSEAELATAIQQCYRHLFYPSKLRLTGTDVDLAHSAVDIPSASEKPGSGQQQVLRALRDLKKLRLAEDEPDSPAYIRDRTPLKKGEITTRALREEFRRDPGLPILVGDDIFIRAIRRGVDSGEYVYRRGELLYGPGDPTTTIEIDEQSVVFTMAYATERGIWPRPAPKSPVALDPDPPVEPGPTPGEGGKGGEPAGGGGTRPGISEPPPPNAFAAEGVLKEALTRLWEQARARKVDRIGKLTIRMFEAGDAFRLLGAVGAVAGAEKTVRFEGHYETAEGSTLEFDFQGSVDDAKPLKEFLDSQMRAAVDKPLQSTFEVKFTAGLAMQGDAAESLTERLARFATGAAYVSATAEIGI